MKRQKDIRAKKFQSKKMVADFIFLPSNFFAVLLPLFIFQTQTLPKAFETPRNNSL